MSIINNSGVVKEQYKDSSNFNTRKEKHVLKIIAFCIMIFLSVCEIYAVCYYIDNYINGYTSSDFLGNMIDETVYGWEAIKNDGWAHLIFLPVISLASLSQCIYFGIKLKENKRYIKTWKIVSAILFVFNILMWFCIWG